MSALDIVGGRVLDPGLGIDAAATVSVADGIITGVTPVPGAGLIPGDRQVVDAGSAGAQTFPGLRRYVIERSRTRILAFLNIAVEGMISSLVGELEDIRWGSPEQAMARARENPDLIVGIKVRLGYQMVGNDPGPALRLAREAADALG